MLRGWLVQEVGSCVLVLCFMPSRFGETPSFLSVRLSQWLSVSEAANKLGAPQIKLLNFSLLPVARVAEVCGFLFWRLCHSLSLTVCSRLA